MAISRPLDRHLFVTDVKTSGGSLNLAKGQVAIVDAKSSSEAGAAVLSSFAGIPKTDKRLQIRVGGNGKSADRSHTNKGFSTPTFSLRDVKRLLASYPELTEQEIDDVVIGYNGINPSTAFNFKKGQAPFHVTLEVSGGGLQYRGGGHSDTEVLNFVLEIPGCDPYENCEECDECEAVQCQPLVEGFIERMRNHQLTGGSPLSEFIDIKPVFSCDENPEVETTSMTWYTLSVCDTGDNAALNAIQAQYEFPVVRINRVGATSTYQVMATSAPDDYETSISTILKGCADCPEDWEEIEGGYLYVISIEDNGTAYTTQITSNLASSKYIANTLEKQGNDAGVGFYTALYNAPITAAEIASFVSVATNNRNTATVNFIGEKAAFCEGGSVEEISWVEGDSCEATTQEFSIILPDTVCGETRVDELQAAYPAAYDIQVAPSPTLGSLTVTLTGTEGTATVSIGDEDYLATFATDLTTTANNFVTAHAAAILADTGLAVTAAAGVLTFTGALTVLAQLAIANTTTNLAGTEGALTPDDDRKACQTRYVATVVTNLVCEECDPVFKDFWIAKQPAKFFNTSWYLTPGQDEVNPNTNCLCGIRFVGKPFVLDAEEALRDSIQFTETSTQIRVAAGYPAEIREGIGHIARGEYSGYYLKRYKQRTHLMGNLRNLEKESRAYFLGETYRPDYLQRILRSQESVIQDNRTQVAQISLEIATGSHTKGMELGHSNNIMYSFYVPFGEHFELESLLNNLGAAAGLEELI